MIIKCNHGVSMAHCKLCKPIIFADDLEGWLNKVNDLGMEAVYGSNDWRIHHAMKDGQICGAYEEDPPGKEWGFGFLALHAKYDEAYLAKLAAV